MTGLYIRGFTTCLTPLLALILWVPPPNLVEASNLRQSKPWPNYAPIEKKLLEVAKDLSQGISVPDAENKLNDNGTFSDLDVNNSNDLNTHGKRLGAIILEQTTKGQLSSSAEASLVYLAYNAPAINDPNWWVHVIGVPENFWIPIFAAKSYINDTVKSRYIERYFAKTQYGPVWDLNEQTDKMSGGNMAPRLFVALVEHLVDDSFPTFYDEAKEVLKQEVIRREPWDGNGLRQDGCLHQHNLIYKHKLANGTEAKTIYSMIYNNNYGKEFLKNAARVMWVLDKSDFDLGDDLEEGIFASFLECEQWLYRYTTVEPTSVGRYINSGKRISRYGGKDAVLKPLEYFQKIDRHEKEVTAALHRYEKVTPDVKDALEGNKHFFVSDLMAHQRRQFMATLRLLSIRTVRPESIPPTDNPQGYFEADGFLTVLVTAAELGTFDKEIFEAYDWARVPGVTCQYNTTVTEMPTPYIVNKLHSYNDADFVGGVSNKKEGFAAMVYARPSVPLRANKSWFFTDSVILCLGSGITLPTQNITSYSVTTIMNQIVYKGSHTVGNEDNKSENTITAPVTQTKLTDYTMKGKPWFHHDSIGYVPLKHTGKITEEVDKRVFGIPETSFNSYSLWLDHGRSPSNANYAYALLPAQTVDQTKKFANTPSVKILSLTNSLHAACLKSPKVLGAAFFNKGCLTISCFGAALKRICTNKPALLMIKDVSKEKITGENCPGGLKPLKGVTSGPFRLQISVADPTQKLSKLVVKLEMSSKSSDVNIPLPAAPKAGKSFTICYGI